MRRDKKEIKDKRIFKLYRRYREIERELKSKYPVHFFPFPIGYSFDAHIEGIADFLKLRDEAMRIEHIIYEKEHSRFVKYVKGGNTYFYTPMKKKERRKSLRKFRHIPVGLLPLMDEYVDCAWK